MILPAEFYCHFVKIKHTPKKRSQNNFYGTANL